MQWDNLITNNCPSCRCQLQTQVDSLMYHCPRCGFRIRSQKLYTLKGAMIRQLSNKGEWKIRTDFEQNTSLKMLINIHSGK